MKYMEILTDMLKAVELAEHYGEEIVMASNEGTKEIISSRLVAETSTVTELTHDPSLWTKTITYFRGIEFRTDNAMPFGWVMFYRKGTGLILGSIKVL